MNNMNFSSNKRRQMLKAMSGIALLSANPKKIFANTNSLRYSNNIILNDIQNELSHFRINCNTDHTKITQTNNNSVLTVRVSSRRNNYEEVIMISLGSIGRYLNRLRSQTTNNKIPFFIVCFYSS